MSSVASKQRIADLEKELALAREQLKEHNRAVDFLSEERRLFKEYFDNTPVMICHLSSAGKILDVNRTLVDRMGLENKFQLIYRSAFTTIFSSACRSRARRVFKEWRTSGLIENKELQVMGPDGTVIDVLVNVTSITGKKYLPDSAYFTLVDISGQIARDRVLRESEKKYRGLFDHMTSGFAVYRIVTDRRGRPVDYIFLNVNPAFEKMTGLKSKRIIGKKVTTVLPGIKKDPADWIGRYGNVAINGDDIVFQSYSEPLQKWFSIHAYQPAPGEFATVFHDVTEIVRSEQVLEHNRYLLARAQELGSIGTWELDIVNNVLTWTDENYRIFGIQPGTPLTYEVFLGSIHPDDRDYVNREWTSRMKTNDYDIEHRLIVNGKVRWVRVKAEVTFDKKGKPVRAVGFTQDITDRKVAEEQIRKQTDLLTEMGALTKVGGWEMDLVARTAEWTSETYNIVELDKDAPVPGPDEHVSYYLPPYRSMIRKAMKDLVRKGIPLDFTAELKTPGGAVKWCRAVGRQSGWDSRGKCVRISGSFQDITDQKKAEQVLAHERDLLKNINAASPVGITVVDKRGVITFANKTAESVLGLVPSDITGRTYNDPRWEIVDLDGGKLPEEDLPFVRVMKTGRAVYDARHGIRHPDGRLVLLSINAAPLADHNGSMSGMVAVIADITEKIHADKELARERDRAQQYLDIAGTMFVALDTRGRVTMVNRKTCEILGYEEAEMTGKSWFANFLPRRERQRVRAVSRTILEDGIEGSEYVEGLILCRDGSERMIGWYNTVLHDDTGKVTGHLSSGHDITERRKTERALMTSETRYRALMEGSGLGIGFYSAGGRTLLMNREGCRRLGLPAEKIIGKNVDELFGPDMGRLIRKRIRTVLEEPEGVICEDEVALAIGTRWYRSMYRAIRDRADKLLGVQVISDDITAEKKAEQERLAAAAVWQETFDAMHSGIMFISAAGIILKTNRAMALLTGKRMEDMIGLPCREVIHDDGRTPLDCFLEQMRQEPRHLAAVRHEQGRWLRIEGDPVVAEDGHLLGLVHIMTDITEQTQSRLALERYRQAVEASSDMVLVISPERKVLTVNRAFLRFFKEIREKVADLDLRKLFGRRLYDEHVGPKLRDALRGKIISDELDLTFEHRGKRVLMFRYYPFRNRDNMVEGVAVSITDVTERRSVERELEVSEQKFRSIIEYAGLGIIVFKPDGTLLNANPAFCAMTGWDMDGLVGATQPYPFWAHNAHSELMERQELLLVRGNMEYESHFTRKTGGDFPVRIVASPILDNRNKAVAFIQIVQNIIDQYRMLARLRESERRYRLLVEDMPAMICRMTYDGDLAFANRAFTDFYGIADSDMVGSHWLEFVPEQRRGDIMERYSHLSGSDLIHVSEQSVGSADGLYRWYQWIDRLLVDEDGEPREYQSLGIDITDRKAAEQRLLDMSRELRSLSAHLQQAREEERAWLARELHDELGQQLTALKMDISFIQKKCDPYQNERILHKLSDMQDLVQNAISTVKQLSLDLRPGVLDDLGIPAALEWLVDDFKKRAELDCAITVQEGIAVPSRETAVVLFRVLQEALTNVARHARATWVRVRLYTQEGMLIMEISDNGTGIPAGKLESGDSFGLIGMRERVMGLGGMVWFGAPPAGGTLIRLSIPYHGDDGERETKERTDG